MQAATMTSKQARFIEEYLVDANGAAAAVRAGYAAGSAKVAASRMLTKDNPVRRAIRARQDADSERLGVSRIHVLAGLQEAINQARDQSNPLAMIRGWSELAKMMGFYAPETKRVEVSTTVQDTFKHLQQKTDVELVNLIQAGRCM